MEKAILKTLTYADIFDYAMKAWEIHKWLVGKKATLRQVEKALRKKSLESRVKSQGGYYFLANRKVLVRKREERQRQSQKYLNTAKWVSKVFRVIPWVKLVGVSGGLAMENANGKDDIDLFVVTFKNRVWLSRLGLLCVLGLLGKRRRKEDLREKAAGKVCINILLDEDSLAQQNKDIYLAHEVLQMRVLWERGGIYSRYLGENSWALNYLPNWISSESSRGLRRSNKNFSSTGMEKFFDFLEKIARWLQLRYMGKPRGDERVSENALYLHPEDKKDRILAALDRER